MLLNVMVSGKIDPKLLIRHRLKLDHIFDAYETLLMLPIQKRSRSSSQPDEIHT
jgi:hypothetical protein